MARVFKTAVVAIALLSLVSTAHAGGQKIALTGILKVSQKKIKGKTYNQFFLVDEKAKKTILHFKLKDKTSAPKMKDLINKKVNLTGMGSTKVVKNVAQIILTEVDIKPIEAEEDAVAPAPDEEM